MDRLILLVGASGAGKSAVAKELEQLGYNILKSHTSREERYEGEWGHTFSNSKKLHDIPFPEIVAFQEVYNGLYYCEKCWHIFVIHLHYFSYFQPSSTYSIYTAYCQMLLYNYHLVLFSYIPLYNLFNSRTTITIYTSLSFSQFFYYIQYNSFYWSNN